MLKKLEKMKMRKRLNFGFGVVTALMVLSGIFSLFGLGRMYNNFNYYVNVVQKANEAVAECRLNANIIGRNVREMAINEDVSADAVYKQKIAEQTAVLETALADLKSTGVIGDELMTRYETEMQAWMTSADKIVADMEAGDLEKAQEDIIQECAPALQKLVETAKELDAETDVITQEAVKDNVSSVITSIVTLLVFILVALIMAVKIGGIITKLVLDPVHKIIDATEELASGNLHSNINYDSNDEIGNVAQHLSEAVHVLGTYVDDISRAMSEFSNGNFDVQPQVEWKGDFVAIRDSFFMFEESMADTVKSIQLVADQVSSGSDQVAASSNDLAQGATDQAAITQELTATANSVSDQVAKNAEYAKSISSRVDELGENIVEGNKKMHEMVESMNEIHESSNEISKIIATINDIAAQTNLLALNASIEAARAGEAGKGFAVVADQVSLLASQSSEAAKESTTLIEASVSAVKKGMGIADETAKRLENIAENSRVITEEVNGIATELKTQITAMEQIDEGILHINDVIQTNSATSEECAAASQEMNNQANVLEEMIRKFKVGKFD